MTPEQTWVSICAAISAGGISDESLPAGLRQILAAKIDFSGTITCLKTSRPPGRAAL
jgi:hypothetical protein